MTGEARVLETDATMFSTESKQNNMQEISDSEPPNDIELKEETNKPNAASRFARLKKSLRKRSISIL